MESWLYSFHERAIDGCDTIETFIHAWRSPSFDSRGPLGLVPDLSYPPQVLWVPFEGVPHLAAKDIPIFCKYSPALSIEISNYAIPEKTN